MNNSWVIIRDDPSRIHDDVGGNWFSITSRTRQKTVPLVVEEISKSIVEEEGLNEYSLSWYWMK